MLLVPSPNPAGFLEMDPKSPLFSVGDGFSGSVAVCA